MELEIELSINDYYQLLEKCRSFLPLSYGILRSAIFRENATGDKFVVRCTVTEGEAVLNVAKRYSLAVTAQLEKAIANSL
jgi:hypothetical protein